MKKKMSHEEDFLYELKEILEYAMDNRRWSSIEEAFEMVCEELGEEPFLKTEDDEEGDY